MSTSATDTARLVDNSQFERKRSLEIGRSSVCPATVMRPVFFRRMRAILISVGLNSSCTSAKPDRNEVFSRTWMMTLEPCVATATAPSAISSSRALRIRSASSSIRVFSPSSSSGSSNSSVFWFESTVNWRTSLIIVGCGLPGLNSRAITLVPFGIVRASISACTPNAFFMEPDSCLNFAASISENASNRTKKHMSSVIRSANVMTQAGTPPDSSSAGSSSSIGRPYSCSSFCRADFGR